MLYFAAFVIIFDCELTDSNIFICMISTTYCFAACPYQNSLMEYLSDYLESKIRFHIIAKFWLMQKTQLVLVLLIEVVINFSFLEESGEPNWIFRVHSIYIPFHCDILFESIHFWRSSFVYFIDTSGFNFKNFVENFSSPFLAAFWPFWTSFDIFLRDFWELLTISLTFKFGNPKINYKSLRIEFSKIALHPKSRISLKKVRRVLFE